MIITLVWTHLAGTAMPVHGASAVESRDVRDARDRFEADHPGYAVVAAFAGEPKELLSEFVDETRYLGRCEP